MKNTHTWFYAILLSLIGIVYANKATAQETYTVDPSPENWDCGYDMATMANLATDTSFLNSLARYDYLVNNPPGGNQPQAGVYIVPVVFHLVGSTASSNVSYNQIKWQLARINAAFANQMNLFNGQANGPRAVNTQIEFRLACITTPTTLAWTNATEPGVMRYWGANNTNEVNQIVAPSVTTGSLLAVTHNTATPGRFPFNKYLNIWCVNTISNSSGPNVIGFGTIPGWSFGGLDGIVMRWDAVGNNSYPTNFPLIAQLDKGAILAHEIGHYLGLYHTFESAPLFNGVLNCYGTAVSTGTTQGDMIKDTPPTKISQNVANVGIINSCIETNFPYGPSADEPDQLENYMSYSDDDKMNTFTQGQTGRMTSAFTLTASPRYNLVQTTNLISTGVQPNGCSNYTGLVSAAFNYSVAAASTCSVVNIKFTNPTSLGFTATSWNWSFGASGASPTQSFVATGGVLNTVVTCTASNGTISATFTQTINVNYNTLIIGQSGTTVCRGTEQTIFIQFSPGAPSVLLTDGTNTVTVLNTKAYTNSVVTIPYTFSVSSSASYSLVPYSCNGITSGVATFVAYDCCANIINNGDFSGGNSGFTTNLTSITSSTASPGCDGHSLQYFGTYTVSPVTSGGFAPAFIQSNTGNALRVDGFACNNGIVNIPAGCNSSTLQPIVYQQVVSGLTAGVNYAYSFKITDNFYTTANCRLQFATSINSSTLTALPTQTFEPTINWNPSSATRPVYFEVHTYTFTAPAGTTAGTNFTVSINQINNFKGVGYDYAVDEISLQQLTNSIQAINSATICKGASAALTATAYCGNSTANYSYAWTPTVGLSSPTTMNTNASPTTTTIYTLVASPTSTAVTNPPIVSTVTITVIPTFTISPPNTFVYAGQCATLTVSGSTGSYTWMPGSLTGTVVTVCPSSTTIYTVTNAASGTCTANNTSTVTVSTACSQSATATYSNYIFTGGTYTTTNQVLDLSGTITFSSNTSFTGYTMRMAPGTLLRVEDAATLTLDNCKLFGCTELWQGIRLINVGVRYASIDVKNGTTIEDMYAGIYRNVTTTTVPTSTAQGYISITNSKLNKNYTGVQILNQPGVTPSGNSYSLTVKNSTITSASSITSPGNTLKPSTIPTYTYAYNQITGGASGSTASYTAFPRAHIGINLLNLSTTNNVVIGDSAGAANTTHNTFSNLDFGIVATNAQLRVHNNSFINLKGSVKQAYISMDPFNPSPTPIGPDEIGIAIVAQHTVANTYSLQVGTRNGPTTMSPGIIYPKSNIFKTLNKGISAKNCNIVIVKCNWFEADTTDIPASDVTLVQPTDPTYIYYKAQSAVWITGLSAGSTLNNNYIRNYRTGLNVSQTMSVTTGAYVTIKSNNIQSLSSVGYCRQAINLEQVGGANIAADLLDVSTNTINRVYNGIGAKNIAGGLKISNNTNLTLDNVKTYGKPLLTNYSHNGISFFSVSNAKVITNSNINSITTVPFTASSSTLTNGVYLSASATNTITCNTVNNVGRGFYFQANCTSPNGWLGNGINNSYRGLELRSNGVIGTQGAVGGSTLAANTWSNVTQETYVHSTTNVNSASIMYVEANGTYTTAPSLNAAATATQAYVNGFGQGVDIKTGTPFSCGGGGTNMAMSEESGFSSGSITSTSNDGLYSDLATSSNTVYPTYPDEMIFQSQQLVYALQKQGLVTKNASNPTLQSFYNANINSNIGKFTDVQDALSNSNKNLAQSKNNSINPTNTVQQKTKRANELMLKLNINCNYQYTHTELQDLVSMANECEVKGWYVAQSRSILNTISGTLINYADNCEDTKANARMANEEEKSTSIIEPKRSFNLFPNPNNGSMTMTYDLGKDTEGTMNLYDVTGKLINTYNLSNTSGSIEINEDQLNNGIYFYCILVNGIKVNTNKIVIIK